MASRTIRHISSTRPSLEHEYSSTGPVEHGNIRALASRTCKICLSQHWPVDTSTSFRAFGVPDLRNTERIRALVLRTTNIIALASRIYLFISFFWPVRTRSIRATGQ